MTYLFIAVAIGVALFVVIVYCAVVGSRHDKAREENNKNEEIIS